MLLDEAKKIWKKIEDHKWYLSERLGRDVGNRVAAVDYLENFYQPNLPSSLYDRRLIDLFSPKANSPA